MEKKNHIKSQLKAKIQKIIQKSNVRLCKLFSPVLNEIVVSLFLNTLASAFASSNRRSTCFVANHESCALCSVALI